MPRSFPTRHHVATAVASMAMLVVVFSQGKSRRPIELPERVSAMQHHFRDVALVHEAIIRGDLGATTQPAARLAALEQPALMPDFSAKFVEEIRLAGQRLGKAPTLANATVEVTRMLQQCGGCHRSMSVVPVRRPTNGPVASGVVAHMLEHQRAVDELLLGLALPSDGRWADGAARLQTTPLLRAEWPRDARLASDQRQAENAIHAMAGEALGASTPAQRASVYARLIMTCASCHRLHGGRWGPQPQ